MACKELNQQGLQMLTREIVETAHPLKIVLFGKADESGWTNDLDLLVVVPEEVSLRQTAFMLRERMRCMAVPFKLIITTPNDLEKPKRPLGLIYRHIIESGRVIYAA
ncbi:MAG: uncharacterized protein PWR28_1464 [Synergistaceae bacterium]|uniref:hypothetical protein n=1 Tax=Acetomicrobium sp. S15 = DSM 107314 TaxID=2529858 RepID=UPI0018E13D5F|nr:hypothetical protein [Acetomicrobium sp. S15 = DSM 107314]MDI3533119.1 uncharacterized protein [Synergistaceae bacterium]